MQRQLTALWQRWITPIHTDSVTAFRERTLRAAVPMFFLVALATIVVILADPSVPNRQAFAWVIFTLAILVDGVFIGHGKLTFATFNAGGLMLIVVYIIQIRQGYWSGYVFSAISACLFFAILIFPHRMTLIFAATLTSEYILLTAWQTTTDSPYPNPLRDADALSMPVTAGLLLAGYVLLMILLNYYHIHEFNSRAQKVNELVDTLEERVAQRTAELEAANDQLAGLARLKDEFVSNVTHELRTPITNLKLYHDLIKLHPDQMDRHLAVLKRETERLSHTIDDLLFLSRLDQDRITFRPVTLDLNALVQQFIEDRNVIAHSVQLGLQAHISPDNPHILGDTSLLEQALGILLTNALHYTPPGGSIVITTNMCPVNGTTWGVLQVEDNGPGITLEDQTRLFDRFFRGTVGIASGRPGTGLGLAILKKIIERHNGQIQVHSTGIPGEGTRFSLLLPLAQ